MQTYDVLIIGGGQSGLALGYYLRRSGLSYKILDSQRSPGGSWQNYWSSLRLFSPAQWSSLPGTLMSGGPDYYPTRNETITYLQEYEQKYKLPVERPVEVKKVEQQSNGLFLLKTTKGQWQTRAVVSATGSFKKPYIPPIPGMGSFKGNILHSADYREADQFSEKKVAIIGEGNSGAQILAEVSKFADTYWITTKAPRFLPDEVDGRMLFDTATQIYKAKEEGRSFTPPSLGDIVMVPPVKEARERNVLKWYPPIDHFTEGSIILNDEREIRVEAVIFCTGFRPALDHLKPLGVVENGKVRTEGTRAKEMEGVWLVGYGSWTGFASATLIGVGRSARQTSQEIQAFLAKNSPQE